LAGSEFQIFGAEIRKAREPNVGPPTLRASGVGALHRRLSRFQLSEIRSPYTVALHSLGMRKPTATECDPVANFEGDRAGTGPPLGDGLPEMTYQGHFVGEGG